MCNPLKIISSVLSPVAAIGNAIGFDNIGNALSRAFTPPGTGGTQALMAQQNQLAQDTLAFAKDSQAQAKAASDAALADQRLANDKATAASIPAVDSEAARLAADARLRKLLSAGASGVKVGLKNLGDAPVGYRTATGA
jgi:hypothetical protein